MMYLPVLKSIWTEAVIAPANEMLQFCIISPAVGTITAFNWRGYGTPRWQLAAKLHDFDVCMEGGCTADSSGGEADAQAHKS
jgi:hypothetical protein